MPFIDRHSSRSTARMTGVPVHVDGWLSDGEDARVAAGPEFRVLGPARALKECVPLPLGGRRRRAVLAQLLVARRQPVRYDTYGPHAPRPERRPLGPADLCSCPSGALLRPCP